MDSALPVAPRRIHLTRLMSIWRSAGWPCRDAVELDLVAAGWATFTEDRRRPRDDSLDRRWHPPAGRFPAAQSAVPERSRSAGGPRCRQPDGRGTDRVARTVSARTDHCQRSAPAAAASMTDDALWPDDETIPQPSHQGKASWRMARPDVFSVRRTSVEDYLQPMVHEVKVSRADLLSDLRHAAKRESYQWLSCETYYVLPACVAEPHEIPEAFGVWLLNGPIDSGTLDLAVLPDTCRASCRSRCGWPWQRRRPPAWMTRPGSESLRIAGDGRGGRRRSERRPAAQGERRVKTYTVAVRTLCEFAAKHGDLDLRFTPRRPARRRRGHKTVAASRGAYRREVSLSGEYRQLMVRGRADGFDPERQLLEEVKTFKGDLDRMPANHRQLHWAQAKVYGWLLCRQFGLRELTVSLVYFDIGTPAGDAAREALQRRRAAGILRGTVRALHGMGGPGTGAPRTARRGTEAACGFRMRRSGRPAHLAESVFSAARSAAACWRRRRPASARPSAPCSRCSRPAPSRSSTRCSS